MLAPPLACCSRRCAQSPGCSSDLKDTRTNTHTYIHTHASRTSPQMLRLEVRDVSAVPPDEELGFAELDLRPVRAWTRKGWARWGGGGRGEMRGWG